MKRVQILLAEDNQGDIYLVRDALTTHHMEHDLHLAQDGEQALRFIDHLGEPSYPPPDVFLLDLNLPRIEGDVVLRRFREHPGCLQTPVIIVTSSDAPQDRERVAKFGIAHYFRKPSDLEEFRRLGAVVKELVDPNGLTVESAGDGAAAAPTLSQSAA